ncbi:MAG: hypothetical protein ABTA24_01395 [Arthrobacter sp.]
MAALNLDKHPSFEDVLDAVAKVHGKPIELRDIDHSIIPAVTGLWVEKEHKSVILLPAGDNRLHRTHAACHEFGHILLRHQGCGGVETASPSVFAHVGTRRGIRTMLARSLDWNETERAAEHVAYLLSIALLRGDGGSSSEFERTFI